MSRKPRPDRRSYQRAYQERRRELGLCIRCGGPAVPNKCRCGQCAEDNKMRMREYNRRVRAGEHVPQKRARPACYICLGDHRPSACELLP